MKKTLILLLFPVLSFGQNYDSLKQSILRLQTEQDAIKLNLAKHSDQFSLGTSLLAGGTFMLITTFLFERSEPTAKGSTSFFILSGAIILSGAVIQIDSHKWIGRAGRRHRKWDR